MSMTSLALQSLHSKPLKALARTILGFVLVSTLSACASQSPPKSTATIESVITLEATATPFTLLPMETVSVPERPSSPPSNPPAYDPSKANLPPDASFADEAEKDAYRALEILYKSESGPPLTADTYQDYKAYLDQFRNTERISILQSWNGKTGDEYQMVTAPALNENWRRVVMWYGTSGGALMARPDAVSDKLYKVVLPGYSHPEMLWGEDGNPYLFAIDKDVRRPIAWFNSTIAQAISEGGIEQAWTEIAPAAAPTVLEHYGLGQNISYIQEGENWYITDEFGARKLIFDQHYGDGKTGVWLQVVENYTPLSPDIINQYQLPSEVIRETGLDSERKATISTWIEAPTGEYWGLHENGTVIARFQKEGYEGATRNFLLVLNEVVQEAEYNGKKLNNLPSIEMWSEPVFRTEFSRDDEYLVGGLPAVALAARVRLSKTSDPANAYFENSVDELHVIQKVITNEVRDIYDQLDISGKLYMALIWSGCLEDAFNNAKTLGINPDLRNDDFLNFVLTQFNEKLHLLLVDNNSNNNIPFYGKSNIKRIVFEYIDPMSRQGTISRQENNGGDVIISGDLLNIKMLTIAEEYIIKDSVSLVYNVLVMEVLSNSWSSEEQYFTQSAPLSWILTNPETKRPVLFANPYGTIPPLP